MKNLPPPITPETFEKMISCWAQICHWQESGSIFWYKKSDLVRRLYQLFSDKLILQKYFGKQKIEVIDVESLILEDENDWLKIINNKQTPSRRIFFIIGMDQLLFEKNVGVLNFLQDIEGKNPQLSFLFFFNVDFSHPQFWPLLKDKGVFIQNIIFQPLYSLQDTQQFLFYLEKKWQMNLEPKIKKTITGQCGGHFWLVKQAVRFLRDNPQAGQKQLFTHEQLQWKLKLLWESFLPSEKEVLKKIIKKVKDFDEAEQHSLNFLEKVGFLKKTKNNFQFTISLLEKFVKGNLLRGLILELDKQRRIFLNGVSVENNFSAKERRVFMLFLQNRGRLISREQVARTLWGSDWTNFYSDWAIDQTISRLRKRLIFLGLPSSLVKTMRSKGFLMPKTFSD